MIQMCKILFGGVHFGFSRSGREVDAVEIENLLLELLEENPHVHPPLGVKNADLKTNERHQKSFCCSR